MNLIHGLVIADYLIAPVGSLVLAAMVFTSRLRRASYWLRLGLIFQIPLAFAWSALGLYLLRHVHDPEAVSERMRVLAQHQSFIAGIAVGSLVALVLSPEGLRLSRKRGRPNQAMQRTADRPMSSI